MPKPSDKPSTSTDIEQAAKSETPLPPVRQDKIDLKRVQDDARHHAQSLERASRNATEPAQKHRYVLLTAKQIDYLLVILKPYSSSIADEVRVKLECAF